MTLFSTCADSPIVRQCGWALIHSLWQGFLLMGLLAAALRLLRGRSANVRYVLACVGLVALVGVPVVTTRCLPMTAFGAETEVHPISAATEPIGPIAASASVTRLDSVPTTRADSTEFSTVPRRWDHRLAAALQPVLPVATGLWLSGVLLLSLLRAGGFGRLRRLRRTAVELSDPALTETLAALVRSLGLSRPVQLLRSTLLSVPVTIGWLRPVILMPATAMTGLNEIQLRAIVAHELAHIRRYDYLLSARSTAATNKAQSLTPVLIETSTECESRVDLRPRRQVVIFRIPVRRYRLKWVGPPLVPCPSNTVVF